MKQKDKYTLRELFDNLPIPLTELSKLSGKSHGTLTRIRDGEPARRSTINKLFIILSEVYKLDLSIDNVTGIVLEERQEKAARKAIEPPMLESVKPARVIPEKAPKRVYNRKKETRLPEGWTEGCIMAIEFARAHDVKRETFNDHLTKGLGPGLIGMSTDTISERDYVKHEAPDNPKRKGEKERYLTPEQQAAAIQFWQRHKVDYSECDQDGCSCHAIKEENN